MKLKLNDNVIVISGKDKGKKGKIMKLDNAKNTIVVEKINIRTRHMKKTQTEPGQIVKYEGPINASNVQVLDPKTGKPTRVGYKVVGGEKIRFAKASGEPLPSSKSTK
ncbi:MAG: 50S ribosomal protein L24 [Candidatus Gracilibacteria bacterium]